MKPKHTLLAAGIFLAVITAGYGQPVITNQPRILATARGTTATFTVGARGTAPLSYQWQKNLSDLPGCTNAVVALTNVQISDQADYRVVVSDGSHSVTSAVAHLYVMSFAAVTDRTVLDNFDDNRLINWITYGSGLPIESNQQFTVRGYWPGQRTTATYDTFCFGGLSTSYRTVGQGQTLEWRVDLIHLDDNATNAVKFVLGTTSGVYGFFKWRDFIALDKYPTGSQVSLFSFERASIRNTNVVLAFALTRLGANVILTARVLDKGNPDIVLYERSVVDTPNPDPTLTTADAEALSGMRLAFGAESSAAPYTYAGAGIGLFQYTDGTRPAATVTYDNLGLWTYRVPITHYVDVTSASPTPPYTNWATAAASIQEAVDAASTGDEIVVTNGIYATGGRAVGTNVLVNRVAVDKPLTVRSVNGPQFTVIQGYQVPGTTNGDGAIRCVNLADGASLSGFTLTNGATRIEGDWEQEPSGGGVWCQSTSAVVSDCVLAGNSASGWGGGAYSGTLCNCTLTGNSAPGGGGAALSTLDNCTLSGNVGASGESASWGGGAIHGTLNNCTLTGNSADHGGGTAGGTANNCTLTGNSAQSGGGAQWGTLNNCTLNGNSAESGGGADGCTLNNCRLIGNSAESGGGTSWGTLNNCTLTENWAQRTGGGACEGTLNNCIVYSNTAPDGANYAGSPPLMNYCCTTPLPGDGVGNVTNAPLFVDYAGGNLRLQSNSPCINAGLNAYASSPTDLDGLPRIISGMVDIGAYEYQGPGSTISYAWLQQYGLPTDGSADFTDPDRDGMNNWQEWRCGTCPTNAVSALRLLAVSPTGTNLSVTWQSVAGVRYFLERSTNLASFPPFSLLATNLPGQPGTTSFTDTNAAALAPLFYRVGVQ
jgi:hypothetical protein